MNFKPKDSVIYILELLAGIGLAILVFYWFYSTIINSTKKTEIAEETMKNLIHLRISLESYYQKTGKYPNLTKEGVKDNLELLDYVTASGEKISFAEIYGMNEIAETGESDEVEKSNTVYDIQNFAEGTLTGGWNYNFSGNTGEIHANLPKNVYGQNISWKEE